MARALTFAHLPCCELKSKSHCFGTTDGVWFFSVSRSHLRSIPEVHSFHLLFKKSSSLKGCPFSVAATNHLCYLLRASSPDALLLLYLLVILRTGGHRAFAHKSNPVSHLLPTRSIKSKRFIMNFQALKDLRPISLYIRIRCNSHSHPLCFSQSRGSSFTFENIPSCFFFSS